MLCPKCKNEIEENLLQCSHCGARLASICKECGAYNFITSTECSSCGKVLLKLCPSCGAANKPESKSCRKCQFEFVKPQQKINLKPEYSATTNSQQKVKAQLTEAIKDNETCVISISGESGYGKNLILRHVMTEIKSDNLIWLTGNCTQITQLSPFGYFQDLLLTFFNINNFCPDTAQLRKNSIRFFKQDFPLLSNEEILDLLNLLYPENIDKYENIYQNKIKMFTIMKKLISTIIGKMKVVFVIDNFENIDGMSLDFIQELLNEEVIVRRCKFIFIYKTPKPIMGMINSPILTTNNYKDLSIAPFNKMQIETFVSQFNDIETDSKFIAQAETFSNGNPAYIEQMLLLYRDCSRFGIKNINYESLDKIISTRLNILKENDIASYRLLIAMALLGIKFYPAMLENFDNNPLKEFERIFEVLINQGFIVQLNNLSYEFKSNSMWVSILSTVKEDEHFNDVLLKLQDILSIYKQSSLALLGYIVQNLQKEDEAFSVWTTLMKQASYVGDIGLYIIVQKQALKLIEKKSSPHYQKIKKNIYSRVGKLLEPIDFETSFEFIKNAIMLLEDSEEYEHIDLLGYLASTSMKKGNYWGVIECVDNVLNKIPTNLELEKTLVKSKQIKPFLRLGNYGQVVNIIDTAVLPIIEKYIQKQKKTNFIALEELYLIWLDIYFDLAEALTFQADARMFDVIKYIFNVIEKNRITEPSILCRAHLSLALANSIKGDIKLSNKILDDILKEYTLDNMESFIVSRWNFIDIINKFFENDYQSIYTDLFNVVAYANNINDNFTKNILKTLLAKMLNDKDERKKALEILEEQVAYFAKEKIATGVLLAWYLIAEIKLVTSGTQYALDIATKALDIAQGVKINNYFFISLFNKLISEIYMSKQDFDSAKIYLEKAILLAKQFGLDLILVKCYIQYAKYYQELALPKTTLRSTYIKQALKMFQLAKNVSITSEQGFLQRLIKDELQVLTSFCRLNGIVIKKNSK